MKKGPCAPLFKGATRPPCVLGVPIKPFIGVVGAIALASLWTWLPLALSALPAVLAMRAVSRDDDQRFRQIAIALRHRAACRSNLALWRGMVSYAPCDGRRR